MKKDKETENGTGSQLCWAKLLPEYLSVCSIHIHTFVPPSHVRVTGEWKDKPPVKYTPHTVLHAGVPKLK